MALQKCHECGGDVSSEATRCPHCGAPVAKARAPKAANATGQAVAIVAAVVAVLATLAWLNFGNDKKTPVAAIQPECASQDLQCRGDKGAIAAGVYCKDQIERLAKHSMRWTDGTFDMKMTRFRWTDQIAGAITYMGDKAEFQNGFGAYTRVIYECDLANDQKSVLDVRIREGSLPS
ncbi:zinc ribbon domain-containing protein [Variovorax sp. GB1P17]|uniref:zinc ribbon domain-containing protein n=1 Tax=Variovorax sp. GB1P17 TaxID=3443740 RepID=UPI003F4832E8